jgi:hypothetical protein
VLRRREINVICFLWPRASRFLSMKIEKLFKLAGGNSTPLGECIMSECCKKKTVEGFQQVSAPTSCRYVGRSRGEKISRDSVDAKRATGNKKKLSAIMTREDLKGKKSFCADEIIKRKEESSRLTIAYYFHLPLLPPPQFER